jgi:hypothetical protein
MLTVLGGLAEFEKDFLGEPLREIARSYNVSNPTISRLTM